jgi:hypothetical protein
MDKFIVKYTDEDGTSSESWIDGDELDTALMAFLRQMEPYGKVSLTYIGEGFDDRDADN